jgi:hypothetical protein
MNRHAGGQKNRKVSAAGYCRKYYGLFISGCQSVLDSFAQIPYVSEKILSQNVKTSLFKTLTEDFMAAKKNYECSNCGKQAELSPEDAKKSECCGKPMQEAEPLPVCETSTTAEHSRIDDLGEPCDDGRAGS